MMYMTIPKGRFVLSNVTPRIGTDWCRIWVGWFLGEAMAIELKVRSRAIVILREKYFMFRGKSELII